MQCSRCQTENRTGRQFCAECGAPLALLWASCGFANEPGEKFCGGCGTPLTTASPRPGEAYASITRSVTRRPARRRRRCHRSISYRLTVTSSAAARYAPSAINRSLACSRSTIWPSWGGCKRDGSMAFRPLQRRGGGGAHQRSLSGQTRWLLPSREVVHGAPPA